MSDFLYWRRVLRSRAYQDFVTGPLPPDNSLDDRFVKGDSALLAIYDRAVKGDTALQAEAHRFAKGDSALQVLRDAFVKGDVSFLTVDLFVKGDVGLVAVADRFLKGDARFTFNAVFIKGNVALTRRRPLEDLGENPPATKPGLIARHWISVASVKKDVT